MCLIFQINSSYHQAQQSYAVPVKNKTCKEHENYTISSLQKLFHHLQNELWTNYDITMYIFSISLFAVCCLFCVPSLATFFKGLFLCFPPGLIDSFLFFLMDLVFRIFRKIYYKIDMGLLLCDLCIKTLHLSFGTMVFKY